MEELEPLHNAHGAMETPPPTGQMQQGQPDQQEPLVSSQYRPLIPQQLPVIGGLPGPIRRGHPGYQPTLARVVVSPRVWIRCEPIKRSP